MNTWPSEYPINPIAEAVPATFCAIESCGDTHGTVDSTELFFSPPSITYQNGELLQKWVTAISQHQEIKFSDEFQLCSRHFEPSDIDKVTGALKEDAVPVYFLEASSEQRRMSENPLSMAANEESPEFSELGRLRAQVTALHRTNTEQRHEIQRLNSLVNYYESKYGKPTSSIEAEPTQCDEVNDVSSVALESSKVIRDAVILIAEDDAERESSADEHHAILEPILELQICEPDGTEHMPRKVTAPRKRLRRAIFECFLCKTEFGAKSRLNKHMKMHVRDKQCSVCNTSCTETELSEHFCDVEERQIACEYCGEWFTRIVDILKHLEMHDAVIKFFRCSKCTQLYALRRLKEIHEAIHEFDAPSKCVCKICSKELASMRNFNRHMVTHQEDRESYLCDECGKSFKLPRTLQLHKLTHSEPTYGCTTCSRKFHTSSELNRHSSRHTREKFVCGLCNAELVSYRGLKTHMDLHKSRQAGKNFSCDLCSKKFYNKKAVRDHRVKHFNEEKYGCEYCDKVYKYRGDLNKHLKTHLGDLLYKCDLCPKQFRYSYELKEHSYMHNIGQDQIPSEADKMNDGLQEG